MNQIDDKSGALPTRVEQLLTALVNFPPNGKPVLDGVYWDLVLLGYIAEHEVKKPCKNCGTSLTDYRYFKITQGGRMFMQAAQGTSAGTDETGTGSGLQSAGPVAESHAPDCNIHYGNLCNCRHHGGHNEGTH